jgi:hypothetical protein
MKNEIILDQPTKLTDHSEVRYEKEDEMICRTQKRMSVLFEKDSDTIGINFRVNSKRGTKFWINHFDEISPTTY